MEPGRFWKNLQSNFWRNMRKIFESLSRRISEEFLVRFFKRIYGGYSPKKKHERIFKRNLKNAIRLSRRSLVEFVQKNSEEIHGEIVGAVYARFY